MGDLLQALMFVTCTRSILGGWGDVFAMLFFGSLNLCESFFVA